MLLRLASSLLAAIRLLPFENRGISATALAIAFPALIGVGALGAETGAWFVIKLRNQSAADAAAISAAYEVLAGKTDIINDLNPAASEAATRNGYTGIAPVMAYPYSDGIVANGIAVTLQQTQPTSLAAMFLSSITLVTKAVAVIEVLHNPCILALGTAATDVELEASTNLLIPDCSVAADSISSASIEIPSSSSITAATLVTAGEISMDGTPVDTTALPVEFSLAAPAAIGAPSIADPYANTLTHSYLIAGMPTLKRCTPKGLGGGALIYSGGCWIPGSNLGAANITLTGNTQISGDWTIVTNQTIDLTTGTYWITGSLNIQSNGVLKCSTCNNALGKGVTIILTTQTNPVGAISMASAAVINLNAPSSGPFPGLLLIQDANGLPAGTTYASLHSSVGGVPSATLNGLIYFPRSSMTFHGRPSGTGPKCLLLVVSALDVDATSSLETKDCTTVGLTNLPVIHKIALAE